MDYASAQHDLVIQAADGQEKREDLEFIRAEMIRQVLDGSALFTYRELAFPIVDPEELLAQLLEVQSARPDLPEAWSTLIAQLLEMGRLEDACSWALEGTRKLPRLPAIWLDAAKAHRAILDWPNALAFACEATTLNPDWPEGWWVYTKYVEDSGDPEGAVKVLERIIRRIPNAPSLSMRLAQVQWRLGRRKEAFERVLTTAVRSPGEMSAWDYADRWGDTLGAASAVLEAGRRLSRERPGEARSWMILARLLPRSEMNEKLQAIDRAITLNPRLTDAYDFKIWLLASQGRYTEAEAASRPAVFGEAVPYNLEGRGAWLLASQGKVKEAMASMVQILQKHPDYHWGWQQCMQWATELKDAPKEREAREALERLVPNDVDVLCECGDGALKAGRRDEAARYYQRAMEIAPGGAYALHQWLRICWGKRDTAAIRTAAEQALPGLTRAVAEVFLVLADMFDGRKKDARTRLGAVVCSQEAIAPAVEDLAKGLYGFGRAELWKKTLNRAVRRKQIGMAFTPAWVKLQIQNQEWKAWKHFGEWIERGHENASMAISNYFDLIGNAKMSRKAKGFFSTPSAQWVRERTSLFGKVGYALANSGQWEIAARWLQGAEEREDAEAWLCLNLVLALTHLRQEESATAVARRVVSRALRDDTWPRFIAQVAFGAALSGDLEAGKEALATGETASGHGVWHWKACLARGVLDVLAADLADRRKAGREAIRFLRRQAKEEIRVADRVMVRLHHLALQKICAHSGLRLWPWRLYTALSFGSRSAFTAFVLSLVGF